MGESSFLLKRGARLGFLGTAAALAFAMPSADGSMDDNSTGENRTGFYGDQTAGAEKLGFVVGGIVGPTFARNGSAVDVSGIGALTAVAFSGGGAGLTGLNASALESGTVPDARLSANVARTRTVQSAGSFTAALDRSYMVTATATVTDPTPAEGQGYITLVRNGSATVGGNSYPTAGTLIDRSYHSGSWATYVYPHLAGAWTWTQPQTFNANVNISTGQLQFAGTDLFSRANSWSNVQNIAFSTGSAVATFRSTLATNNSNTLIIQNDRGSNPFALQLGMWGSTSSAYGIGAPDTAVIYSLRPIKIMADGAGNTVTIGTGTAGGTARLTITDTGAIFGADAGGSELLRVGGAMVAGNGVAAFGSMSAPAGTHLRIEANPGISYLTAATGSSLQTLNARCSAFVIGTDPGGSESVRVTGRIKSSSVIVAGAGFLNPLTTIASSGQAGEVGTICWDTNYIYVCTGASTWKRVAISTW